MIFGSPLDSYLDPGEKLVWSGQPKQGLRMQASDWIAIPFSLVWCGFAFIWEMMALGSTFELHDNPPTNTPPWLIWFFPVQGVPFICIGLYLLIGRFFVDGMRRAKTWYGITEKRVIVLQSMFSTNVNTIDYINLTNLNLIERKDNSGDVLFGPPNPFSGFIPVSWPMSRRYSLTPGFYMLPQARQIYSTIREFQRKARS